MTRQFTDQAPPTYIVPVEWVRRPRPEEERTNPWPFIWTLFAFKVIALGATWFFATRSRADTAILSATHWIWLLIPAAALAGPAAYQWRLRRLRRRRAQLQAAEWMVDELRSTP